MTSGSRSSPAITSAGSPGNKCCSEKIRIDTKNSVGISCNMRLARKLSMRVSWARRVGLSLQLQPDHAHQSIRHLRVAFQLGRVREKQLAVIDIDERIIVKHD